MLVASEDKPRISFALDEEASVEEFGTGVPDSMSAVALVAGQELTLASAAPMWNVPVDGPHKSSSIDFSGCGACGAAGGCKLSSNRGSIMYAKLGGGARARY